MTDSPVPVGTVTARPGDLLLNWWAIAAVGVLVVNDHILKWRVGSVVTGKLSDVVGVFLLPLLTLALVELAAQAIQRPWRARRHTVLTHIAVVGTGFAAVKTVAPVGDAYEHMVGLLRAVATGSLDSMAPIIVYRDVTDLIVLPVLACTYLVAAQTGRTEGVADGWGTGRRSRFLKR